MGNISWTKSWSASDNGTVFGGADLQNIQNDITTVVNGGITDTNIDASADIQESKMLFDTSTGHTHDGSDSRAVAPLKHYRSGMTLKAGGTADAEIVVQPGSVDVGGVQLVSTADSSAIDINTGSWWTASGTTLSASEWIYVYVYDDSGSPAYILSDETPDLSWDDDSTAGLPLRYQKYGTTYYRCLGAIYVDADTDLCWGQASSEGRYVTQFDASNNCVMCGLGTGSDQELVTLWTPKYARTSLGDGAPATGDVIETYEATLEMLDGSWDATLLNMHTDSDEHEFIDEDTDAGAIKTMTAQTTSVPGHVDMKAHTDGHFFYFMAHTDLV